MRRSQIRRAGGIFFFLLACLILPALQAQPSHYEPTLESLNQHPLPQWYADAKLGIFIHWGLYSVPGWAPLVHPQHDFTSQDYISNNPYAEWYLNSMRLDGSPTHAYHRDHYGADYDYYNFAPVFDREIKKWDPDAWAKVFRDAGAKYVVLTSKHHDGFTLWPSAIPNPMLPADRQHATRDIVGELTAAVRSQGLRMGLYYSGGYDWTFVPGPIGEAADYQKVKPQSEAYGKYADAHLRELIERYHPAVLWNDIDYPKSGHPLEIMAEYYNAVPDGVIDDRFGVKHSDFKSPEYQTLDKISETKWEECRGLGRSFGYNRAEGEAETIAPEALIHLLVDIVSKNGNLLLDIGPEADGTIPPVQMSRLQALGEWLQQNGEAVYATQPWKRAVGETAEGIPLRFTRKDSTVYATIMGRPKTRSITLKSLSPKPGSQIYLLGDSKPVAWSQQGEDVRVDLPPPCRGTSPTCSSLWNRPPDRRISRCKNRGLRSQHQTSRAKKMNRRFCLTLDLKNDPALIAEYKRYHQKIWPEITQSIKDFGVEDMEIYLLGTRMFMIMEVNEGFSFEAKARADEKNAKVQEWENLMWKFQQALPEANRGEKWLRMERIFKLEA